MADDASAIHRNPAAAAGRTYDVIVVGGGIYGAFVSLEAARRGLRTLLLERDDFGGATSGSSLRIAHGGLRYLQSLDLRRFRRSVQERAWLRSRFPHLVREMGCIMPLHGEGLRRPSVMRAALRANDIGVGSIYGGRTGGGGWPSSRILDARTTREVFPAVEEDGLRGSAFWYDGLIRSTPRLLVEVVRWSCTLGGTALNYVEALEVQVRRGEVTGVRARDRVSGREHVFRAPAVVNAAGAAVPRLAATAGAHIPELFHPTLAFNLLLRKAPLSDQALAVTPRGVREARTFFMVPWNGRILAGTWHGPWRSARAGERRWTGEARSFPPEQAISEFLDALNRAAPGLEAGRDDVARVYAGLLPGGSPDAVEPRKRAMIVDHALRGEARGLFSVSGVKYTTARRVAERTVRRVWAARRESRIRRSFRAARVHPPRLHPSVQEILLLAPAELLRRNRDEVMPALEELVRNEAVLHLDDLLLRRTDWGADPMEGGEVARFLAPLLERIPEWIRVPRIEGAPTGGGWSASADRQAGTTGVGPAA